MSIILPEIEIVDRSAESLRYLEHGWPTELCRWHTHEEFEIHLITATTGKTFVGDYIGTFKPGSLFLTGSNLPHNWVTNDTYEGSVEIRDMLVQFGSRKIESVIETIPEFRELKALFDLAPSGVEFIDFDPEIAKYYLEQIRDGKGASRIISLLTLLDLLNRHPNKHALSVVQLSQKATNMKTIKIGEVVDYITENFADEFPVARAASMAGMSETSFSRNFHSVTGNRFTEFVNRIRIGQACVLLFETDEQVSSICYDVGFQNIANFNRHFHKMKNMTPSEFRNSARTSMASPTVVRNAARL